MEKSSQRTQKKKEKHALMERADAETSAYLTALDFFLAQTKLVKNGGSHKRPLSCKNSSYLLLPSIRNLWEYSLRRLCTGWVLLNVSFSGCYLHSRWGSVVAVLCNNVDKGNEQQNRPPSEYNWHPVEDWSNYSRRCFQETVWPQNIWWQTTFYYHSHSLLRIYK